MRISLPRDFVPGDSRARLHSVGVGKDADPLVGRLIEGRYHLDEVIALGGMSTVYLATDLRLERTVAVKVMNRSLAEDPGFVERFEREAKAAAKLSHPNVVGVLDQGDHDGLVFLVMEYVPGHTLRDVVTTHGALEPARALGVVDQVLQALAAAHDAGFVHRDIKPENVLITDAGTIKVADFGLARAITDTGGHGPTQGLIIGTVAYLSPEQVEAGTADTRSDVYACGILLFELLTGQVPFNAPTPLAVAYKHVNEQVPAPSSLVPDLPPEVDALVGKATIRKPRDRYPDAHAFLTDLHEVQRRVATGSALSRGRTSTAGRAAVPVVAATVGSSPAADTTTIAAPDHGTAILPASQPPNPKPTGRKPDKPARRRPGSGRWGRAIALVVLLVIAAVVAAFAWWLGSLRYVPAPDIVGQSIAEAQASVAGSGLTVEESGSDFSEDVAKGIILRTEPTAGVRARVGSAIAAIVSKGPERYEVPDVRSKSPEAATGLIGEANLTVSGSESVFDDTVPPGQVAGTDPAPTTALKKGSAVTLLVSKGPAPVAVPDVTGQSAQEAASTLSGAGLVVKTIEAFNESVPSGSAVGTSPTAGTQVKRGDPVDLTVSKGPPPVSVPSVVDLKRADAVAKLEAAGLNVTVKNLVGVTLLDRVTSQDPSAGSSVPKGSTVTITII